jgi:hypothetical protein
MSDVKGSAMPKAGPALVIKKPISALHKPLQADFKGLFKSLAKLAAHGFSGKWAEVAPDAAEALSAVGLATEPGELAWLLVNRSLSRAMYDLVGSNATLLNRELPPDMDRFSSGLDEILEQSELKIDRNFFGHPADLELLPQLQELFRQWLEHYGLDAARSKTIVDRLPTFFVYALNEEWRRHAIVYAPITTATETPFSRAGEIQQAWDYYYAWLQMQVQESMFDETFSLSQIYVPVRAYYEVEDKKSKKLDEDTDAESIESRDKKRKRVVVDLATHLDEWLAKPTRETAVRVVSGGPGSGKSSFAKIYAGQRALRSGIHVLFIPLHQFDLKGDLVSAVGNFIKESNILPHNPLDAESAEKRLLLIFDGLDELAMLGKVAEEIAQRFIREVEKTVSNRNLQRIRVQAIISGRTVVVQANASEFRIEGQILHLLPYDNRHEAEQREAQDKWIDKGKLLQQDQRNIWWQRYGDLTGRGYVSLPEILSKPDLDEVT